MSLIDDAPEGVNTPEFTVSDLSLAVKRTVEGAFGSVRVRGEVGRVSRPRSGHIYLDLKDDKSVLCAVVWRGAAGQLEVQPQEGDEVIATGRLSTFPGQSRYQLIIDQITYAGAGALLAKLDRLRKALAAEGLFAEERKRALPYLPRVIGVVTSPSGAVIRDILHRLAERFPVRVLVWPVAVQGAACAPEVAAAIRGFCALAPDGPIPRPDVLIVARGGGSVEDLWGFNDEAVVRAAAACTIPLISAVGHETDTTLIDHAADRRAPTPSAAAEMAVPVRAELLATLAETEGRRLRGFQRLLAQRREALAACARALPNPAQILAERRQRLDHAAERHLAARRFTTERRRVLTELSARLPRPRDILMQRRHDVERAAARLPQALRVRAGQARLRLSRIEARLRPAALRDRATRGRDRFEGIAPRLDPCARQLLRQRRDQLQNLSRVLGTLDYGQTLHRGYVVVRDQSGSLVQRAAQVAPGDRLEMEFADGRRSAIAGPPGKGGAGTARKPEDSASRPASRGKDGSSGQGTLF